MGGCVSLRRVKKPFPAEKKVGNSKNGRGGYLFGTCSVDYGLERHL